MERYPVLNLILRFGAPASVALAILAGAIVAALGWTAFGPLAVALGAIVAGVVFLVAKSYVEIVTIITEMLVPR